MAVAARLICVDDDPLALDQLRMILTKIRAPISCEYFGSPKQAIEAHKENPATLILSDLRMGATTGLKMIAEMREFAPDSIYMLLSGEADLQSALIAMNEVRVFRFFTKPAQEDELTKGIFEALREYNLQEIQKITSSTLGAFEKINAAIASVDAEGKVLYANDPAQEIFNDSAYFSISNEGYLKSINSDETKAFLDFLKKISTADDEAQPKSVFRFSGEEGVDPVVVSAVCQKAEGEGQQPSISLMVSDPSRKNVASVDDISIALNLTRSEARVVYGLIVGGSVDEAAEMAGVSLSTARTYLKNVFSKTGVSRQAELVRLVMMTAA